MLKWGARKRGETGAWFSTTVNFVLTASKRKPGDSMGLWDYGHPPAGVPVAC